MEGTGLTKGFRLARLILLVGVIAGLCFSAGEGLRLTPLPVSAPAQAATRDARPEASASLAAAPHRHGPLDKPSQSQAQKRGKRQSLDCDRPPPQHDRDQSPDLPHDPDLRAPAAAVPTRPVERPAGRAPPRTT